MKIVNDPEPAASLLSYLHDCNLTAFWSCRLTHCWGQFHSAAGEEKRMRLGEMELRWGFKTYAFHLGIIHSQTLPSNEKLAVEISRKNKMEKYCSVLSRCKSCEYLFPINGTLGFLGGELLKSWEVNRAGSVVEKVWFHISLGLLEIQELSNLCFEKLQM